MKVNIELVTELSSAVLMSVPALWLMVKKAVGGLAVLPRLIPWPHRRFDDQARAETALLEVNEILVDLEETVESIRNRGAYEPWNPDTANERLDEIVQTVNTIIDDTMRLTGQVFDSANEKSAIGGRLSLPAAMQFISQYSDGERARIFISTGAWLDTSGQAYTIEIHGNRGFQQLSFASGTTQSNIISAIQQYVSVTGVVAVQDRLDPALVRLTSRKKGRRQYVGAKRLDGNLDNILLDENRSNGSNRQYDFGK